MEELDINNVNLFNEYIKVNIKSLEESIHLPYLIGSPIKLFKDNSFSKKNDALIPVVVLIKLPDGTSSFEEVVFSWSSIDLLQTYARIDTNGQLNYLGNQEQYMNIFDEKKLEVDPNNVQELTLDEVVNNYHFYSKLTPDLRHKYKNEKFLLFLFENNNYIVPAIEVVRYFYCFSNSDSLKQAIFHPSGLNLLVKKCTREIAINKYDLYMETLCEIVDKKKIFYFVHNEKYTQMFHSVFFNYINNNHITAQLPFEKPFQMACKTLKLATDPNTFLITRIIDSNMINTFFKSNNIDLHVHHPLSKEREDNTGKRDPNKDRKQKVPRKKPDGFNDQLSTVASIPAQTITDEPYEDYFPEEEDISTIETNGKREEQGGQAINIPVNMDDFSTNGNKGDGKHSAQKVTTSNEKPKIKEYPSPMSASNKNEINDITSIEENFKKNNFTIKYRQTFYFPDRIDGKQRAISYTNDKMNKKRSYVLLSVSKNNNKYLYLDVEQKGTNKEVLVLINLVEEIVHKCVYQQVHYGNHKWLSKDTLTLEENVDFIRIRHSETAKQIVENIIEKLSVKPTLSSRN